jgi:SPP1 family predicted phage head-tail adaptor
MDAFAAVQERRRMKNTSIQPGQLDQKIKIWRDAEVPDGMAGCESTPTEIANVWAEAKPGKPTESLQNDTIRVVEQVVFVVRRGLDVLESDTIEWGGVFFDVRGIPSINKRSQYFEIYAERGVAP